MKRAYLTFICGIALAESILCYTGLLVCSFMVLVQVVNRYMLHFEIMWIGDLTLFIFVPMMILSISYTTREGGHTSVDVFMDMIFDKRPLGRKVYQLLLQVLSLSIMFYMLPMAFKLFKRAIKYPEYATLVPWFNTSWIRETVLVMVVLCIVHTLHHIGTKSLEIRKRMLTASQGASK
ncbi:TRAP transporter small permease [Desulfocurvus sp. DL9XJH121]